MIRDKVIHMLKHLPGIDEQIAKQLKAAGIMNKPALREADDKTLKEAGMKAADIAKLRARLKIK